MNKILSAYILPQLNHEELENLSKLMMQNEIGY